MYQYIIVGGGTAGCVLANRLSEKHTVCLIEAGPDTPPENVPDAIYGDAFLPDYFQPSRYWTDLTVYADAIGGRTAQQIEAEMRPRRYEQARIMGGGSAVNGQVAIRGLPADYDEWQALGAQGWSYAHCLPYFQKIENDIDFPGPPPNNKGPIPIRRIFPPHWSRFVLAMRDAVAACGIPYVDDCHAQPIDSCFPFTRNNLYDHRVSSAAAYLDEATRRRANLTILPDTVVDAIVATSASKPCTPTRSSSRQVHCNRPRCCCGRGLARANTCRHSALACWRTAPASGKTCKTTP